MFLFQDHMEHMHLTGMATTALADKAAIGKPVKLNHEIGHPV